MLRKSFWVRHTCLASVLSLMLWSPLYPASLTWIFISYLVLGGGLAWLYFSWSQSGIHPAVASCLLPLLALVLLVVASPLWSNLQTSKSIAATLSISGFSVFLFVIVTAFQDKQVAMEKALLLVAFVVAFVAFASIYWQLVVNDRPLSYRSFRIYSLGIGQWGNLKNPIDAGLYFGPFGLILLNAVISSGRFFFIRILAFTGLFSILCYLLLTYSRGAMIAFLLGSGLLCIMAGGKHKLGWLLTVMLSTAFLFGFGESLLEAEINKGFNGREPIWVYAFQLIYEKPWLGHGAGVVFDYVIPPSGTTYHFAHNYLLTLWVHYGLAAPLLLIICLGMTARIAWYNRHSNCSRVGLAWLVFGFVGIQSYVDELIRMPHPYWLLLWFPVGLILFDARRNVASGKQK